MSGAARTISLAERAVKCLIEEAKSRRGGKTGEGARLSAAVAALPHVGPGDRAALLAVLARLMEQASRPDVRVGAARALLAAEEAPPRPDDGATPLEELGREELKRAAGG